MVCLWLIFTFLSFGVDAVPLVVKLSDALCLYSFLPGFSVYSAAVVSRWIKSNQYINMFKINFYCISLPLSETSHSLFLHPSGAMVMTSTDSWPVRAVPWASWAFCRPHV